MSREPLTDTDLEVFAALANAGSPAYWTDREDGLARHTRVLIDEVRAGRDRVSELEAELAAFREWVPAGMVPMPRSAFGASR